MWSFIVLLRMSVCINKLEDVFQVPGLRRPVLVKQMETRWMGVACVLHT